MGDYADQEVNNEINRYRSYQAKQRAKHQRKKSRDARIKELEEENKDLRAQLKIHIRHA